MYLNPVKSRVSNANEILNRASLQLKGIINVGASENDLSVRVKRFLLIRLTFEILSYYKGYTSG